MKKIIILILTIGVIASIAIILSGCDFSEDNNSNDNNFDDNTITNELSIIGDYNYAYGPRGYILHDSKYNQDYIVVVVHGESVAITPRLK